MRTYWGTSLHSLYGARRAFLGGLCLGLIAFVGSVRGGEADRKFLVAGVSEIAAPGVPGPVAIAAPEAFAVAAGAVGRGTLAPVVVAGKWDRGRVVAFGHTGYFDAATLETADTGRLMQNAARWAAGRSGAKPQDLRIAVVNRRGLGEYLRKRGFAAADLAAKDVPAKLKAFDAAAIDASDAAKQDVAAALTQFVGSGKGLLMTSLGWGWLQLNPGKDLIEHHPGNRLLVKAGIAWADGTLNRTAKAGFAVDPSPLPLLAPGEAFEALTHDASGRAKLAASDRAQAAASLSLALRAFPLAENPVVERLRAAARQIGEPLVPLHSRPITTAMGLKRAILSVQLLESQRAPAAGVRPHPAAAVFPGAVPDDAPRVQRSVSVDTKVPGWHSTGLYAPPGATIEAVVPAAAAGQGLVLRIGCHNDRLWHLDAWRRCPEICTRHFLNETATKAANPFGGPIYVESPARNGLGTLTVQIRGGVEAPYFVLGKTQVGDWRDRIRRLPAPWAELATDKAILTVPSAVVRDLDDPTGVLEVWDRILDACAELAGRPAQRVRPERYVADEQISAGYMHAGYPVMTHLDAAGPLVSRDKLLAGQWGLFHETGHNHQGGDWTFEGTGEVTVNLFSLYVCETVCGLKTPGHPEVYLGPRRSERYRKYAAGGLDFNRWKSDPFLALVMYVQLREAFGWNAYKTVFAEYRDLPASQRPRSDQEKRDQWLVRFSRTVGKNLGPFYQAWGVPISDAARASIADLPAWMPEGFPPKQ